MFRAASLVPEHNHWRRVFDFNKGEAAIPEPHWTIMREHGGSRPLPASLRILRATLQPPLPVRTAAEAEVREKTVEIEGLPGPVNPVPRDSAPSAAAVAAATSGPEAMMTFDIRDTSQAAAEEAVARASEREA